MDRKKLTAVIALLVAAGAIAFLALSGLEENIVYYWTPTDLLAKQGTVKDSVVRLGGMVQKGTLDWDPESLNLQFVMGEGPEPGGASVKVISKGAPPQMFREGIGCIVEGRYDGQVFHSERLIVKHSNEYKPPTENEDPRNLYKTILPEPQSGSPIPERPATPPPGMSAPSEPPVEEKL
jgi:cytochrome c-type biogenesis protein CcmE